METIRFSYNWNNKLTNRAFTTIRLHNPNKYKIGESYRVECNGQLRGIAEIKDIRTFAIYNMNDFIIYLDTGYNVTKTVNILKTMYKKAVINWDIQKLDFCLLVYDKEQKEDIQIKINC